MEPPIVRFKGEHRWLSNFAPVTVTLDGVRYPSVEHAYQAAKTLDPEERAAVRACESPGRAKRMGKRVTMRDDWAEVREATMLALTRQKYAQHEYRARLLATGQRELVEGNTWGDTFWGVCEGVGDNRLGRILTRVRAELREAE